MTETTLYESLDALLERERSALINGDLASIGDLLAEKEALMERLALEGGSEKQALERLQGKAVRNQALLDSALRGIRTVATRFATLRRIRKTLETYDEHGHKSALPAITENKVERRA
ncbi:hypothetical protein [Pseudooceanicola onchidii]|uniref:hypothetical protein n=1 Tax=Pseudooceanicola onchidii TaxID=2562279 RepID=UPI0010AA0C9B|nr:hypothetical protein [Pseudooceanicola onchidii]